MTKSFLSIVLGVAGLAPAAFADIPDYMLNVNGTTYCPGNSQAGSPGLCGSQTGLGSVPGLVSTLNTTFPGGTGLGTMTLTFNPGTQPGSYFVNLWLFENVDTNTPFDEYGSTGGSLASGQSWQIDVPDTTYQGELGTAGAGTIVANTAANKLADTNYVPGKTSDINLDCSGATCDDATSMALGFGFSLLAGQQEVVTFTVSQTAPPSGFYLAQTDPNNSTTDYFYGSATTEPIGTPPPPSVPEPGSWILLGTVAGILGLLSRRRVAAH